LASILIRSIRIKSNGDVSALMKVFIHSDGAQLRKTTVKWIVEY